MTEAILILLVANLALTGYLLYLYFKNKAGGESSSLVQEITAGLISSQLKFFAELSDQLSQGQIRLLNQFSENIQKLEQRFGELQLQIQTTLNAELSKIQTLQTESKTDLNRILANLTEQNKLEFERLKAVTQTALQTLQDSIQSRLEQSIKNLMELNKNNFDLLSRSNQEKLLQIQAELDKKLGENLSQNLKSFEVVTRNLADMQKMAEKMVDSTSSIDKLNSIFERTSGKAFGDFGEKYLDSLLGEYLDSAHFGTQVSVPGTDGKIDFVIRVGDQKIGIDCKFPVTKYNDYLEAPQADKKASLSQFLKAVTTMASDIHSKYGKTKFVDSLLIYLPSDSMFATVVGDEKTINFLQKLKVNPASPTTIVPILALVRQYEFKVKIQENAQDIIDGLTKVKRNVDSFREEFKKLGDKIRQAQTNYEQADRNLGVVQKTILQLEANHASTAQLADSTNLTDY